MKFRKYLDNLVGTVGELSSDGVTYMFTVRPGEEPKTPAKLIQVDEDFVVVEVTFRRMKVNRVIPFGVFSLCISEE
jgi:hypothetical protein